MKYLFILLIIFSQAQENQTFAVYFENDSFQLQTTEKQNIDSLFSKLLKPNSLTITGFCDQNATDSYNQTLSEQRAQTVSDYIIQSHYFSSNQIKTFGKGEIKNQNLAQNRRVEITFNYSEAYFSNVKIGDKLSFQNLLFIGGSHQITPETYPILVEILHSLQENPSVKVKIEGHICCHSEPNHDDGLDDDTGLYNLSEARAQAIYDYLIQNGIAAERLSYEGKARNFPLGGKDEDDRRVEFIIVEN